MDFFKKPIKKREKLLALLASFWIKFTYLCLQQVYSVFSPHLFPAFDHFGVVIVKNKLEEFENDGFSFSCGRKTFGKQKMTGD